MESSRRGWESSRTPPAGVGTPPALLTCVDVADAHARGAHGLHPLVHLLFALGGENDGLAAGVREHKRKRPQRLVLARPHVALVEEDDTVGLVTEAVEILRRRKVHEDIVAEDKPPPVPPAREKKETRRRLNSKNRQRERERPQREKGSMLSRESCWRTLSRSPARLRASRGSPSASAAAR